MKMTESLDEENKRLKEEAAKELKEALDAALKKAEELDDGSA